MTGNHPPDDALIRLRLHPGSKKYDFLHPVDFPPCFSQFRASFGHIFRKPTMRGNPKMQRSKRFIVLFSMGLSGLAAADLGTLDVEKAVETMERYIERHSIAEIRTVFPFFADLVSAPLTARECADGVYQAESGADDYHYRHVIRLQVLDGRITAADYDEIKTDGTRKQSDSTYNARMAAGTGTSPSVAYPVYESALVQKQDLAAVNAVTGATYSLYRFRMTAARALLSGPVPPGADTTSATVGLNPALPGDLRLLQNYPNPFNAGTRLALSLPGNAPVRLEIVDAAGRRVRTLLEGRLGPGDHVVRWDGRDDRGLEVPSGVLLVRLTAWADTRIRTITSVR
jgi:major membrane immunogen (membrane-anchored lipoprotein)